MRLEETLMLTQQTDAAASLGCVHACTLLFSAQFRCKRVAASVSLLSFLVGSHALMASFVYALLLHLGLISLVFSAIYVFLNETSELTTREQLVQAAAGV